MAQPMNESQKIDILEACWDKWGNIDLRDDYKRSNLESRMHHLITEYTASPAQKIDNDQLIEQFIAMKVQEEREADERFGSPNYYYGVSR